MLRNIELGLPLGFGVWEAHKCPVAGGPSVHRARTFIALFNDSIIYNDTLVCLQQGIYRTANDKKEIIRFTLIPNPADNYVEIKLSKEAEGICNVRIANAVGTIVKTDEFNCNKRNHIIKTHQLKPGIYFVGVSFNDNEHEFKKLIIVR